MFIIGSELILKAVYNIRLLGVLVAINTGKIMQRRFVNQPLY